MSGSGGFFFVIGSRAPGQHNVFHLLFKINLATIFALLTEFGAESKGGLPIRFPDGAGAAKLSERGGGVYAGFH